VGEGFGEPGEEQVEASVEFGGAVVGGEDRCQGAEVGEVGDRQSVQTEPQNVVCFFGSFDDFLQFIDDVAVQVGLLHVIIGYLAIRIALGTGGGSADQSGALAALSAKPGGIFALWAAAIALLIMALWRLAETALGRSTEPKSQGTMPEILDRAKAFALAVVYLAFAYSALGFARSAGKSTGHQNSALSARLMQSASGTVVLVVGGVIIVAVGGYHIYKGASRNFLDDLKGTSSDLVRRLGVIGYIAKGLAIAGAGVLVIIAASLSQPDKATGLDGALKTLGAQPYGAILLILASVGIITYGLYSFAMARYAKM
jgi:hypothetical protein